MGGVGIIGLGSRVPEKIVTNDDFVKMGIDTSDEWISTRSGIKERRFVKEGEATSYLAYEAAKIAIEDAKINPQDLDLIIVATCTPDYLLFPSVACIVQDKLGLSGTKIGAFDVSGACTGFIYALKIGYEFIKNDSYKRILIIGADVYSPFLNFKDRGTCVLFGDGAGAVILGETEKNNGILSVNIHADGSGRDLMGVPAGGSEKKITQEVIDKGEDKVFMNGKAIFKWAINIIIDSLEESMKESGIKKEEIDMLIAHQANLRIIEYARKKLNLPLDSVYVNIDRYGNTSAASIPLALHEAWQMRKIKEDMIIAMVGFGAGLTYGAAVMRWNRKG